MRKSQWGALFIGIGAVLVLTGVIILLMMVPGWLWCVLGALILIGIGLLILRPTLGNR